MTSTINSPSTTSTARWQRTLLLGAVAGMIASMPMALYAMVASLEKGTGFFTPLYHIASVWAPGDSMMMSMESAMGGSGDFTFTPGTALLGLVIHLVTGAGYGMVFAALVRLIAARAALGLGALVGLGLAFGLVAWALSAYVGLPLAASIFDSGDPVRNMPDMAGQATFFVEHLLFGAVLGLLVSRFPGRRSQEGTRVAG